MEQTSEIYTHELYFPRPALEDASPISQLVEQVLTESARAERRRKKLRMIDPDGLHMLRSAWKKLRWLAHLFYGRLTLKINITDFTCVIEWETERLPLRSERVKITVADLMACCETLAVQPGENGKIRMLAEIPLFLDLQPEALLL